MGIAELIETIKALPEAKQAEVVDFVEFLARRSQVAGVQGHGLVATVSEGVSLSRLAGGLESSSVFNADPLAIQREMRDEWN